MNSVRPTLAYKLTRRVAETAPRTYDEVHQFAVTVDGSPAVPLPGARIETAAAADSDDPIETKSAADPDDSYRPGPADAMVMTRESDSRIETFAERDPDEPIETRADRDPDGELGPGTPRWGAAALLTEAVADPDEDDQSEPDSSLYGDLVSGIVPF